MFTYQITIEYLGTNFVGWQVQKNGLSVQEILEKSLSKYLKDNIRVVGSGRTDAGVHASEQSAHFKTKYKIIDKNNFLNSINFFLSKYPVAILGLKKRQNGFHARHSAIERTYKYFIINRSSSLVLEKNKAWHIKKKLDVKIMKKGANILKGTHNFSTFRASSCQAKSPIKTMKNASVKKNKHSIVLTFKSKSFLQKQVRSMVGSLKYLGEGKWNLNDFKKVFLSKKRKMCAPPAPAYGLYLTKIKY
ncbi:MAG: tRNA pseudouridine(38-40) synthase TruA [Pelagibacteraceae bacterium]|nr:tRNA pseudouridine(38-40) synthase TruA [Pelagibacteraceae bacterium]|tara:strand:+ start:20696 stop:21436 length:741 start_codon:yes stop_codon:yes gene_type:complete